MTRCQSFTLVKIITTQESRGESDNENPEPSRRTLNAKTCKLGDGEWWPVTLRKDYDQENMVEGSLRRKWNKWVVQPCLRWLLILLIDMNHWSDLIYFRPYQHTFFMSL